MYRGRLWSRRELCGYASPAATNQRLKYLLAEGESAANIIFDMPTQNCVDSDHPRAEGDIGVQGVPVCSLQDMLITVADLPLDKISFNLSTANGPVLLTMYVLAGEQNGFPRSCLRGTIVNDTLHYHLCGYHAKSIPIELGYDMALDSIEFCIKEMPLYYPISVDSYDIRENGVSAPQEIAFGLAMARQYIRGSLERGLSVDDVAARITFTNSCDIDIFEEVAKLRAARRLWARMIREEFGAQNPKAWRYKFHVHTAGCSLVPQQPLNNAIRVAYEALAAVLAGAQSMHTCSYDEPIALPTEEAHLLALRTQQILAYETGVASVVDPLGGSYYVEALTDAIEAEILKIAAEIEDEGGMLAAIRKGWVARTLEEAAYERQREVEAGERIVVGVNAFTTAEEEDRPVPVHRIAEDEVNRHLANLAALKRGRDSRRVARELDALKRTAENPRHNLVYATMDACKAGATLSEIYGAIRMARGYPYDPFGELEYPFAGKVVLR
jgi:methylmalonyl-CoA mutase N-terminal domain/subunit